MSLTVDVNVLVYAANADDPRHEQAVGVLRSIADAPDLMYLFWPTIMGFLRITTRHGVLPRPLAPARARAYIDALLILPNVRTGDEGEGFWPLFTATAGEARGDLVPDAHVAALMRRNGVGTILTRDRDFRRFDGIRVVDPFA